VVSPLKSDESLVLEKDPFRNVFLQKEGGKKWGESERRKGGKKVEEKGVGNEGREEREGEEGKKGDRGGAGKRNGRKRKGIGEGRKG
jgi:hypothetical protein